LLRPCTRRYRRDVNVENFLGSKGQLARAYAELVEGMLCTGAAAVAGTQPPVMVRRRPRAPAVPSIAPSVETLLVRPYAGATLPPPPPPSSAQVLLSG
jgi:hypothetical protein